jgi:hypothetical protein
MNEGNNSERKRSPLGIADPLNWAVGLGLMFVFFGFVISWVFFILAGIVIGGFLGWRLRSFSA